MGKVNFEDFYNALHPDDKKGATGVLELIIKDKNGRVIDHVIEKNIIKIPAKEMLSHRLPSSEIWDPTANGGSGDWVNTELDENEEFAARYILLGASFDENQTPIGTDDERYYSRDTVTGQFIPVRLSPAADFGGGLINAIPIKEPDRPLKRIETVSFKNTYQPSGNPLLDSSVRAENNIVVLETVIRTDEYNGFSDTANDLFLITEVALAGGHRFEEVPSCDLVPTELFLRGNEGTDGIHTAVPVIANGTNIVTIDPTEPTSTVAMFKKGDTIKLVNRSGIQDDHTLLDQINPFYLVVDSNGGRDLELDRVPVDSNGSPISGNVGTFRNTLRIFSHRILSSPVRKSSSLK